MRQVSAALQDVLEMTKWRQEPPKATWQEIEVAVDERINQLRAQLIEDLVQMGETEGWDQKPEAERPTGTTCGKALVMRGQHKRFMQTNRGEAIKLTRMDGTCPQCGVGFFPLDEQLGLLSSGVTPRAEELLGVCLTLRESCSVD